MGKSAYLEDLKIAEGTNLREGDPRKPIRTTIKPT